MIDKEITNLYRLKELPVLSSLDDDVFNFLMESFEPVRIYCGETLFIEGDHSQDLFLVAAGRLRFIKESRNNIIINELGRGELIGELAILTKCPRSATAVAVRDTLLLKLTKRSFNTAFAKFPLELMEVISPSIKRLTQGKNNAAESCANQFLLFFDCDEMVGENYTHVFKTELSKYGSCKVINFDEVHNIMKDQDAFQEILSKESVVNSWITEQQLKYDYIIYQAQSKYTAWTQKCIRECDRTIVFCDAKKGPKLRQDTYEVVDESKKLHKTIDLVLIHPDNTINPSGTIHWIRKISGVTYHHIHQSIPKDLQRVIRIVSGNSVSLVLSGGGAPAVIHLGLFKALNELGIHIDCVGGSCTGSAIAAHIAMGLDPDKIIELTKTRAPRGTLSWIDTMFPFIALTRGKKINNVLQAMFSDIMVEDLWIKVILISTNLSNGNTELWNEGLLWRAVRYSMGLPVIFPPIPDHKGYLQVDGAVVNNLPVDIVQNFVKKGKIIAARLHKPKLRAATEFYSEMSSYHIIKKMMLGTLNFAELNILEILDRTAMMASRKHSQRMSEEADVCLDFKVDQVGFFDTRPKSIDLLVDLGYRMTMEQADEILKKIRNQ